MYTANPCPPPTSVMVSAVLTSANATFDLFCLPTGVISCLYNITTLFLDPRGVALATNTGTLTDDEVNSMTVVLYPGDLRNGISEFDTGVVINVTMELVGSDESDTNTAMVPGG